MDPKHPEQYLEPHKSSVNICRLNEYVAFTCVVLFVSVCTFRKTLAWIVDLEPQNTYVLEPQNTHVLSPYCTPGTCISFHPLTVVGELSGGCSIVPILSGALRSEVSPKVSP